MTERNRFAYIERSPNHDTRHNPVSSTSIISRCKNCDGKKIIIITEKHENDHTEEKSVKCPVCKGSGVID